MDYIYILYLNSANADYKDLSTGRCSFDMKPPIELPAKTQLKMALHNFSFTNFFTNIYTGTNDKFYYTNDAGTPNKYSITIPEGSYSVSDLSDAINSGVINNGHTDGLITLIPDYSTNKVLFSISTTGWQLYFPAGSPYILLGTTLNQKIPSGGLTTGAYSELATNVATFNSILQLYLHTNLTNSSLFAGKQSDIIASITPTAEIGSIQETSPTNLLWTSMSDKAGMLINTINLNITDQSGNTVKLSDDFSATLIIAI